MTNLITKLENLAAKSDKHAERRINNLIGRIKYFESINDENKLNDCIAEAELHIGNDFPVIERTYTYKKSGAL